jgi:hypothetical protein
VCGFFEDNFVRRIGRAILAARESVLREARDALIARCNLLPKGVAVKRLATISACLCLSLVSPSWADQPNVSGVGDSKKSDKPLLLQPDPKTFQDRLRHFLNSASNTRRTEAARVVDLNRITVEIEGSAANLSNAGLRIHYELQPGAADSADVDVLVKAMVLEFLKQNVLDKGKRYELRDRSDGFSRPVDELFSALGYSPSGPDAWTPESSFDVAYACYIRGLHADAIVVADRGLALRNDARLQLIKGVCQLHLGQRSQAESTAAAFHAAVEQGMTAGLGQALERVNDPSSVQFRGIAPVSRRGNPVAE